MFSLIELFLYLSSSYSVWSDPYIVLCFPSSLKYAAFPENRRENFNLVYSFNQSCWYAKLWMGYACLPSSKVDITCLDASKVVHCNFKQIYLFTSPMSITSFDPPVNGMPGRCPYMLYAAKIKSLGWNWLHLLI